MHLQGLLLQGIQVLLVLSQNSTLPATVMLGLR